MDEIIKKAYLSRLEDCLPVDFSDGVKFGVGWCKDKKFTEEDVLKYAWFLVENIGQYACDKTANFDGKYLEQFKNKQD